MVRKEMIWNFIQYSYVIFFISILLLKIAGILEFGGKGPEQEKIAPHIKSTSFNLNNTQCIVVGGNNKIKLSCSFKKNSK